MGAMVSSATFRGGGGGGRFHWKGEVSRDLADHKRGKEMVMNSSPRSLGEEANKHMEKKKIG